jgi:hypothetical protein
MDVHTRVRSTKTEAVWVTITIPEPVQTMRREMEQQTGLKKPWEEAETGRGTQLQGKGLPAPQGRVHALMHHPTPLQPQLSPPLLLFQPQGHQEVGGRFALGWVSGRLVPAEAWGRSAAVESPASVLPRPPPTRATESHSSKALLSPPQTAACPAGRSWRRSPAFPETNLKQRMQLQEAEGEAWMLPEVVLPLEVEWASSNGSKERETALPAVALEMLPTSAFHSLRETGLELTGRGRAQVSAGEEEE